MLSAPHEGTLQALISLFPYTKHITHGADSALSFAQNIFN